MTEEKPKSVNQKITESNKKFELTAEVITNLITIAQPSRSSRVSLSFLVVGSIITAASAYISSDVHLGLHAMIYIPFVVMAAWAFRNDHKYGREKDATESPDSKSREGPT